MLKTLEEPPAHAVFVLATLGITIPPFVVAPLLQIVFGLMLAWLPVGGWNDGALRNTILPVLTLIGLVGTGIASGVPIIALMAVPATRDLLVMVSTMVFGVAGGLSVRFWLAGVAAMDAMPPQEPPPKAASIKACPTLRVPCVADV